MFFKKKNKVKEFETKCIVILPDSGGIVEVNQAAYDYIRELEHDLAREKMMKNCPPPEEPRILYECDRKGCNGLKVCRNTECRYTHDINHASNFHKAFGNTYLENVKVDSVRMQINENGYLECTYCKKELRHHPLVDSQAYRYCPMCGNKIEWVEDNV